MDKNLVKNSLIFGEFVGLAKLYFHCFERNTVCYMRVTDGDLGPPPNVRNAYMKQKHRMIWERRHGPVGSGMGAPPIGN